MNKILGMAFAGAAVFALAACGSSGDDGPAPETGTPGPVVSEVPSSAQQSPAGLLAFANAQVASQSETAEPLVVGDASLPVDDTTETSL